MPKVTPKEIKERRQALRLTQVQFADMLGYTRNAVQKWEAGERTPHPSLWRSLRDLERELAEQSA